MPNPFEIASQKGIVLLFEPLGGIYGYHHTFRRIQIIHINDELDEPTQRFVCAHELGHAVLHPELSTSFLRKNTLFCMDKVEREANEFAVELLLSDDVLYTYRGTDATIYEAAAAYGIPKD
ncbi:ImmA/IrrE family metallo-endopeptidase [Geobacillus subterraneus]|uniref:ImmA/IrrE family metallo-endopeptidase n=1 Tax=Geobacillus subterraneus TaxID=129338 RepID=UPI001442DAA0|nr:ImmA/IrrE family metallo-endopeptidase [Geobacillus subterraneus]QIZ69063.1 ImmA/IrrE family metallo-endopeptidase [Geobacillus subterraneus]WPZ17123.1 ImmA/IrrE family metallo-endopeptidase [Geobacillus subterraneus]